jgi:N-acyl-D-aspartate/D-glutamate deacylase
LKLSRLIAAGKRSLAVGCLLFAALAGAADYDLVLRGGRVIDPETGRDGIYDVGLAGGRIAAVSAGALAGAEELDVSGLVVAPGFIDLHSHSPTPLGFRYQALDGVTTSLELEAGAFPVKAVGAALAAGSPVNYGASVSHVMVRLAVLQGVDPAELASSGGGIDMQGIAFTQPATPEQVQAIRRGLDEGLDQGGLGIGLLLDYLSAAVSAEELRMIFEVAAARDAPVFVHIRRGLAGDPAGLAEVIDMARATGAPVHVCHLQHSAMKGTGRFLAMIRQAREEGVDITTEMFPYNAGTTAISAAVFGRDWQAIFDITYEDVEWAATGERFDRAMWEQKRRDEPEGLVIHHYVKEAWTREALVEPGVMVVTDGTPALSEEIGVPPQGIGSYSRVLGRYLREEQALDLVTALEKMTLLPARRLENLAPVFRRKGRIQEGADADITIFDPATITDRATYREPFQASEGVRYLLVNGRFVVRDGRFVKEARPGKLLTALSE